METDNYEIDEGADYVGYREAFELIASHIRPVGIDEMSLDQSVDRIAAGDVVAQVSYPSIDVSLKDGFAVKSVDVAAASRQNGVFLKVTGSVFAGLKFDGEVKPGGAVKICSGAPIPRGSDAVVSEEFCEELSPEEVCVKADAEPGRNVLRAGGEVKAGATIVKEGRRLLPGYLGLAAAAGVSRVGVYRRPVVAVVGVGDEVVVPGEDLSPGQLYASNLVTMESWLASFGISCVTSVVKDSEEDIKKELKKRLPGVDVIMTSGGAWGSERDLVIGSLARLGWQEIFHHVRMGPGKGIAFGIWQGKPVFCLPGGPASNEMAFLQLALPGILRMSGDTRHPLETVTARLTENLKTRHRAWTEFKDATLSRDSAGNYSVGLYKNRSRLQAIASANSLVCIPEGTESLSSGDVVPVQILVPRLADI
ncbi:MAG: molybdopterin molybdotransferase MoeA [Dehalococcoidales bacterium]|nr:molybdopterin molybdotransferase MoeA [Dehalococcoidales bacterium]